jgi:predicted nicotinamide N-methyase
LYSENLRTFEIGDSSFTIKQDTSRGLAGSVWDSALVFLGWLNKNFSKLEGKYKISEKTILEVGSGTGVCGIAFSLLKPKLLVMTDMEENLDMMKENLSRNIDLLAEQGIKSDSLVI